MLLQSEELRACRTAEFYDENGRISEIYFLTDSESYFCPDVNGVCGLRYERDADGNITAVHFLDMNSNILSTDTLT